MAHGSQWLAMPFTMESANSFQRFEKNLTPTLSGFEIANDENLKLVACKSLTDSVRVKTAWLFLIRRVHQKWKNQFCRICMDAKMVGGRLLATATKFLVSKLKMIISILMDLRPIKVRITSLWNFHSDGCISLSFKCRQGGG